MSDAVKNLEVEIDLRPGEKLKLPQALVDSVGPASWRITVAPTSAAVRRHDAFLAGYAAEDEGRYDDDAGR